MAFCLVSAAAACPAQLVSTVDLGHLCSPPANSRVTRDRTLKDTGTVGDVTLKGKLQAAGKMQMRPMVDRETGDHQH